MLDRDFYGMRRQDDRNNSFPEINVLHTLQSFLMLHSSSLVPFQGHVVTNYHVVAAATKTKNPIIKVKLQGMEPLSATIVGYEPEKDLAVLRISTKNLPNPISVGSSNDLQVGQNVLAIGNVIVVSIPFLFRRRASPSTLILKHQPLRAGKPTN